MDENKNIGKWLKATVISAAVLLIACIALVVAVDPFFQYHKPLSGFPYVVDNQLSANAGMAKNFDYDSILTGSSMVSNFDLDSFESKLSSKCIKVNYNGAYPKDISNILEYVFSNHENLKTVYFGMDIYSYNSSTEDVKYPFPEYLYDNNYINDISYVFNKDVLFEYIIAPLRFPAKRTELSKVYMMEYEESQYSKESVIGHYETPVEGSLSESEYDERIISFKENLSKNLVPFIESHPETEFVIFYPPYSILYWDTRKTEGWMDLLLKEYRIVADTLLEYGNVKIYNFSDAWEYTENLDNYVDYMHQHARVNEYILDCIASDKCRVTRENVSDITNSMREHVDGYDFSALLGE